MLEMSSTCNNCVCLQSLYQELSPAIFTKVTVESESAKVSQIPYLGK